MSVASSLHIGDAHAGQLSEEKLTGLTQNGNPVFEPLLAASIPHILWFIWSAMVLAMLSCGAGHRSGECTIAGRWQVVLYAGGRTSDPDRNAECNGCPPVAPVATFPGGTSL
jgi:hypothetical protein